MTAQKFADHLANLLEFFCDVHPGWEFTNYQSAITPYDSHDISISTPDGNVIRVFVEQEAPSDGS